MTKKCSVCKIEKDENEFYIRRTAKNVRSSWCKLCMNEYDKERWKRNKDTISKRKKIEKKKRTEINTKNIFEYLKKHSCIDCGESDPIVLEFDHIEDKKYSISVMHDQFSWKTILKEIEKCEVRCANCHRRKTAKQFNWYRHKLKHGDRSSVG